MKIFFVQFCVFLPPLLNISASVRSIPFLSFIEPIFAWNVPLVSLIILKRSLVFPILLFSSISLHWSLRKAFLYLLAILWNSAFRWEYLSFSQVPLMIKNPPANAGDIRDAGSIPGLGRSPGGGHGKPLLYSCLENPIGRGNWQAMIHRIAKSQICLNPSLAL